ncbi:MAG: cytidylate kinase [Stygiobacter sp.]|nr:MAG: cytidylate kinase [Stygiobacter sp.]KAF0215963.1 MAG: cytidylate [Ignavibacteria bacterium]
MSKNIIIAIDGPAGSGKSTAAKNLAQKLGFTYLDTGAMYRTITYLALRANVVDNHEEVIKIAQSVNLKLQTENGRTRVFADGEELTEEIRTPEVNSKVSEVSVIPEVRVEMVKIQKALGGSSNIVAEGRDVTTVVYPNADIKIFLTASIDERANRRFKEYQAKNENITIEEVKANLEKRDKIDSGREVSPLRKADDAFEFDNTGLTPLDDLDYLLEKIKEVLSSK